ncbi:integrase domain-containing protein [uncultured Photobacterium sp.]|uniref:integrase domain-containing protein n=1 Tax=uncultured Photobacterium sp. TaxID=173973 RepID=UPI002634B3AE|nr:integrase domain-containing protein [uncultured Photobacterium sp.]
MPRITKPLTATQVKEAKAKDKEYNLSDGDGLQLRVSKRGTKSWLFNYYRPLNKKRANLSLGPYPEVSLSKARELARNARELVQQEIDPSINRKEKQREELLKQTDTLRNLAQEWFEVKKTSVSAGYAKDIWRSLELHVFPSIGTSPVTNVNAPESIQVLKVVEAKGSLETVRRLCQRLNEIMDFAVNTGRIQANPLSGIKAAFLKPQKKNMPTIKPDELPELMATISKASIKFQTRCLIEFQLHTMTRPAEAAKATWKEISFEEKLWTIPETKMKMARPHIIPLSEEVISILHQMRALSSNSPYVFPSFKGHHRHMNTQTVNAALKRMGYSSKLVGHGLRALASTTLNEQGFNHDVIEVALAHIDKNHVRAAYNRAIYLEQRIELMAWWSNHITSASRGSLSVVKDNTE